ncbi:MAG: radical SAM protein [Myxococcota bacterium]|nr:radical SAM protein [Myxococcota bacterium]
MPIRFSTPDLVRACLRALKPRTTGVFFTGGEPTQLSWLQGLLSEARDLGFQRIQMQSHAGRAADAGYAEALVQAGLTAIDVPIYGHTPELHQVVTRTPGSFQRTLAGLENLRSLGVQSVIHVTLFRSNLAHLEQILRFIDEVGPNEAYLQVTGETGPPGFFADAAPGPGEVARACLKAFDAYSPTTRIRLSDVVPCLVPALEERVIRWQGEVELKAPALVLPYSEWLKVFSAGGTRSYGEDCGGCSIRDRCDGLPREILQLHGERELSPI